MVRTLIFMNTAVFGTWVYASATHDNKLKRYLTQNAVLSWSNIKDNRYWTLVTSAFSHQNIVHIVFNIMALKTFGSVLSIAGGVGVGPPHVFALFIGSAVAGSLAFLYQKKPPVDRRWGPYAQHGLAASAAGLGASGAVMGFVSVATCLAPLMPVAFAFIPVPTPMFAMTGVFITVDLLLMNQNDFIGHSAHLGGALFGTVYYMAFLRRFGGINQVVRHLMGRR